jgi:predicted nucleic acid-binding protein
MVLVLLDSSVLIEHFRSRNKENTLYHQLRVQDDDFAISPFVEYEILAGSTDDDIDYWSEEFQKMKFLEFSFDVVKVSRIIKIQSRRRNKSLDALDVLIAATAIVYEVQLATLNRNHFERIEGLNII